VEFGKLAKSKKIIEELAFGKKPGQSLGCGVESFWKKLEANIPFKLINTKNFR
jgi:hypothetical protein